MFANIPSELIWFVIGCIFLLGELAISVFILVFFGIGAWLTVLAILIGLAPTINIQLLVFLVTSILALVLFRKKFSHFKSKNVQLSDYVGSHGIVIEDINPRLFSGKIELNGTRWQAISDEAITKGTEVEVVEQQNLTLKVKSIV